MVGRPSVRSARGWARSLVKKRKQVLPTTCPITSCVETPDAVGIRIEEAMVFGRGTQLFAAAVIVACMVLVGPSAPSGALFARSVPVEAVKDVVPNRVMTWNICNPCEVGNVDRAAEIAAYAPQVIGLQEACVRDVERIREYLESLHGLVYHVEYGTVLRSWGRCGECRGIRAPTARRSSQLHR